MGARGEQHPPGLTVLQLTRPRLRAAHPLFVYHNRKDIAMHKNIAAFTAPSGPFPPYVSINRQDDGSVTIDVRGPPAVDHAGHSSGFVARINLTSTEWAALLDQCNQAGTLS